MFVGLAGILMLGLSVGCASSIELQLDVYTDFVPDVEFDGVVISVTAEGSSAASITRYPVGVREVFVPLPRRLGAGGVMAGPTEIEVRLERGSRSIIGRRLTLTVQGDSVVPVYLLRSCAGVVCPRPGGSRTATECDDGRCVEPGWPVIITSSPSCVPAGFHFR